VKDVFVLLELMNHMVLVAKEAKARGYRIVALNHDPLRSSGPFAVPDDLVDEVVYVDSWQDPKQVAKVIEETHHRHEVQGTYSGFEAPLPYEATLRELAGLPNNGAETVRRILDKASLRTQLRAAGLTSLRSVLLREALEWDRWQLPGPAVLKPAHGSGSALCHVVSSLDELRAAAAEVAETEVPYHLMREYIRGGGFVVEEKATGELLSVESLVYRGEVRPIGLTGRHMLARNPVVEMAFLFPYHHPRADEIIAKVTEMHRAVGFVHGPSHVEVMVAPDGGPIELVDFNARVCGGACVVVFSDVFGVSYPSLLVDLATGQSPDMSFLDRPHRYGAEAFVQAPPEATELRELVLPLETTVQRVTREPGQRLSGTTTQLDAVGMFLVTADTAAQLHEKVLDARRRTLFNGVPLGECPHNEVVFSEYVVG